MSGRPVVDGWAAATAPPEGFEELGTCDLAGSAPFKTLVGKVPRAAFVTRDRLVLVCEDEAYAVAHDQDCCEHVALIDVCGDPESLVGRPIVVAESVERRGRRDEGEPCPFAIPEDADDGSWTWQFVKIGTDLETLTIQFQGNSNGYYNERAGLYRLEPPERPS